MGRLGFELCWAILKEGSFENAKKVGVTADMLRNEARETFEYIAEHNAKYGQLPAMDTVLDECDVDEDFEYEVDEPVAYYADLVVERHTFNQQRKAASGLADAMRNKDPKVVHEIAKSIVSVGLESLVLGQGIVVNQKENAQERWDRYQHLKTYDGGIRGIRSSWSLLDAETGGWRDGALITCVARMGLGKTFCSILQQVEAEKQGRRVGFVSPEMSREGLELRRDAILYKLPYRDLLRGELDHYTEEHYHRMLFENSGDMGDSLVAAEGYVRTVTDAAMFAQDHEVDMLFVDGMYLLDPPDVSGRTPWHERVMLVVRALKELALRMSIPVFATGQFNRNVRSGSTSAGTEAIGHTDAIGQFSDIIMALFQPDDLRNANQMMVSLLKNRDGRLMDLLVNWDMGRMNFDQIGDPEDLSDDFDDGGAPIGDDQVADLF